jgi:hypothetical protein
VPDPRAEYAARIARWDQAIAQGERAHHRVSNLRLALFAAAAMVAWLAFGRAAISGYWIGAPLIAFLALVVVHARVLNRNERSARARRLYERGLARLDGTWAGTGSDGARFLDGHLYARDLDLFGESSLFQLVNTARTEAGEEILARWFRAPAELDDIRARQQAVDELRSRVDFREDLAVLAAEAHVGRTSALAEWAAARPIGLSRQVAILFAGSAGVSVVVLALVIAEVIEPGWLVGWGVVLAGIALSWRRPVAEVIGRIGLPAHDLMLVAEVISRIERETFASPRLAALHDRLFRGGIAPSKRIGRLRQFISALESTDNLFFRMTALPYLLMVRSQAAAAIDGWHASYGAALGDWLAAVGELEAFSSLATYAYEHPGDPFPELLAAGSPRFEATALAHPLIHDTVAVANDVALGGEAPQVLVVSGSNMSGKSTLLRAIGVNVVLALSGAPVRARQLALSRLALGATLRVEDSLAAGYSRFYAEILRIRAIVEDAGGPIPLLFLLDEILHGTNSFDRRIGAHAIARSLISRGAIGLITTHDLALTDMVSALEGHTANVHFEDQMVDGALVFDYKMRTGVVERSNALALMRAVGLDV